MIAMKNLWDSGNSTLSLGDYGEFDYKNKEGNVLWGYYYDPAGKQKRWNWAYIYNGGFIRYDAPGNIIAGYGSSLAGIPFWKISTAAAIGASVSTFFQGIKSGEIRMQFSDDPMDAFYLKWGSRILPNQ
ncbi:hypothetical protein HZB00_04325 [Candidatus Woesearchaeota archaeon]|nr:hypothetical protein [Candidatus Woesearchaeota archaeon]